MLTTCTRSLLKPLTIARRMFVVCTSNQERLYPLSCRACQESRLISTKGLKDITPPYLLNQLKYNSDSYLQRDFHDDDDYERCSQMIPRNITQNAASMTSNQDNIAYDEDYDQFYSHMTPSSIENQDHEVLESLEMIEHEDVESSEQMQGNYGTLYETSKHETLSSAEQVEDEEFVELEEDWEIMHQNLKYCRLKSGLFEVCDNIDDVIQ